MRGVGQRARCDCLGPACRFSQTQAFLHVVCHPLRHLHGTHAARPGSALAVSTSHPSHAFRNVSPPPNVGFSPDWGATSSPQASFWGRWRRRRRGRTGASSSSWGACQFCCCSGSPRCRNLPVSCICRARHARQGRFLPGQWTWTSHRLDGSRLCQNLSRLMGCFAGRRFYGD